MRRTFDDDFDLPDHLLGPGVRDVLPYPPSRRAPIRLTSDRDEYRVADMAAVYEHAHRAAESVRFPPSNHRAACRKHPARAERFRQADHLTA